MPLKRYYLLQIWRMLPILVLSNPQICLSPTMMVLIDHVMMVLIEHVMMVLIMSKIDYIKRNTFLNSELSVE